MKTLLMGALAAPLFCLTLSLAAPAASAAPLRAEAARVEALEKAARAKARTKREAEIRAYNRKYTGARAASMRSWGSRPSASTRSKQALAVASRSQARFLSGEPIQVARLP